MYGTEIPQDIIQRSFLRTSDQPRPLVPLSLAIHSSIMLVMSFLRRKLSNSPSVNPRLPSPHSPTSSSVRNPGPTTNLTSQAICPGSNQPEDYSRKKMKEMSKTRHVGGLCR
ncbi:hypothetical protein P280DRAFT_20293 [Massarina eburnea CBS 473.64]|uniref:Uncharacterized protein n=1 Tax=Massarina eburnea CBS 473.64 TaxID=1395130 RepID=A0A6A6SL10_9PLEO|nr:hypothetical protein P280DRAFT_20293 [Massarina eburnea CBS 473.64]